MQRLRHSRTGWLAIVLLVAMAAFVLRLFYLQILQHGMYTELARASQQQQFVIPAERGKIYMMDGQTLAPVVLNRMIYTVIADPQAVEDGERSKIIASLKKIAGGEMVRHAEAKLNNKKSRYEVLARNISRTQAEKLRKKNFVGMLYQQGSIRDYPENGLGAHVLGFVNASGDGQYGVEGALEKRLKGQNGFLQAVTDVRNVPLTVGKTARTCCRVFEWAVRDERPDNHRTPYAPLGHRRYGTCIHHRPAHVSQPSSAGPLTTRSCPPTHSGTSALVYTCSLSGRTRATPTRM